MLASSPPSASLSMPTSLHRTALTDVAYHSDSLRWSSAQLPSPPTSTSWADGMDPAPQTVAPSSASTRRSASVNPTLQIDDEIAATQSQLRRSPHNAWFIVAYSSQGQQLPASPPTSANTSPQIDSGTWTSTPTNNTTAFRLHVIARSSSSTESHTHLQHVDDFMADLRSALDAEQVHWAILKFDGRILCVQIFDGNVSGLRRARALVHGRTLFTFLASHDGPKSLLQVTAVAQLTPSWLLSKLATSPPPPPSHHQEFDMPPRWMGRSRRPSELAPVQSDGIPWESSSHAATLDSPTSPLPPSVPGKEDVGGPIKGFSPFLGPLTGSSPPRDVRKRNPLEDLKDLHERWSKSSSSMRSHQGMGSEGEEHPGNKPRRKQKHKGAPSLSSRSKSSTSLASAFHSGSPDPSRPSRHASEQSSIPSRPPLLPLLSGDTTRTSSTSIGTLSTAPTSSTETWDGSRTVDREKYQSTYSSSANTHFSGTSSLWKAQPDFGMVDDVLEAMRKSSIVHPIDGMLPTVKESGESSRYERVGTAGSWYAGEASSRRGSGGTVTVGEVSVSGNAVDWRALPAPPLPNTPMPNPHKALPDADEPEEEKSEFLRFQEAEKKRIEELERAEKRRRERARQKKDEQKRIEVMTKLINEQSQDRVRRGSDAGSVIASLALGTTTDAPGSSASSLKASKRGRPRAASAASGRSRSKTNENLPIAPPPRIPLPIPAATKPPTGTLPIPPALQTAPRTRSPLSNSESETPSTGTGGTPQQQQRGHRDSEQHHRDSEQRPPSSSIESPRPSRRRRGKTVGNRDSATSEQSQRSPHSSICSQSFADSEALFDPKLTDELARSFSKRHRHDMSVTSVAVSTMDADDSSSSSISARHYRALSESRKAKRRLEEQGLELSSWISKLSDSKIKPTEMSKEDMEQARAQPRPHHRPHPVVTNTTATSDAAFQRSQDGSPSIDKDLPCPPPLSPHIPPKDVEHSDTEQHKVSEARRRALAAQSAAEEQIRVARELQQRLEFELSEVLRRGKERNDAENAARAKWARDQAQRNLLDAFERSVLESEERKRRQYVDKIRKMEADQAAQVAQEKLKADQAEREAIAEHKRRRDDLARRDQKLQEEAQTHQAEIEKRQERIRAEKAAKEKLKEEARAKVKQHSETAATPSETSSPLMVGFLELQPVNSMLWKRRYFHLTSTGLQLFKGVTSTDTVLETYPLPGRLPEDAFEMCQMAHSIFWECGGEGADVITVAFDSARSRDQVVAIIEVLLEDS